MSVKAFDFQISQTKITYENLFGITLGKKMYINMSHQLTITCSELQIALQNKSVWFHPRLHNNFICNYVIIWGFF